MYLILRNERESRHYTDNRKYPIVTLVVTSFLAVIMSLIFIQTSEDLAFGAGKVLAFVGAVVFGSTALLSFLALLVNFDKYFIYWDSKVHEISKLIEVHNDLVRLINDNEYLSESEVKDIKQRAKKLKEVIESERKKVEEEDAQKKLLQDKGRYKELSEICDKKFLIQKENPVEKQLKELESEGY